MADKFGVSMPTARRWLYKLAGEGLVTFCFEDGWETYAPFCALIWGMACEPATYKTLWQDPAAATTPSYCGIGDNVRR